MNQPKRIYDSPRQIARREAILKCARESLSKHGYEGLTMRGLAEEVGVATSTLYNLYGNKDDLLLAAVDDLLVELADSARSAEMEGIDAILMMNEVTTAQIQKDSTLCRCDDTLAFTSWGGQAAGRGSFRELTPVCYRTSAASKSEG